MGVSTGQVFQPKIMSVVEPQKRASAWEQVLPTILTSLAQTAVKGYIENKVGENKIEQEKLAKGYTKNPDGTWNPPKFEVKEVAPGMYSYSYGGQAGLHNAPKPSSTTVEDLLGMDTIEKIKANPEQKSQIIADALKAKHPTSTEQIIQDQVWEDGTVGPGVMRNGKLERIEVRRPGQAATPTSSPWGLQSQSGASPTQTKQTISANAFSPTTRTTPAAAPITPTQPVAPSVATPITPTQPSTTAQVVGQAAPQYAVSAPKKTDVAKPSFEQDLAIKSWAVKNGLDPESLTAPQKQEALMEAASDKVKAQEEMKRAGIDVPTLAAQVRKGTLSTNAKAIMGASGSRAAVRPMIAGEVMKQVAEENARADGLDWNSLTKEQQQSYKSNAYFDFDKMEANYAWETSPIRTKNITFIDGITPRVKALELKANQLPNTNFKSANELQKWFKTQIGDKAYTDYESLLTQVVQEANTALSGSATGSDLRINLEMQNLNSALSPAQLKAGLNNLNSALLARREALSKDVVPMPIILGKATDHEWATALNDFYNRQAERIVGDYKDHTDIRHPSDETVMKIIAENRKGGTSAPVATAAPTSSFKPMDLPSFYTEYARQFPDKFNTEEGKNRVWADWLKYRKAMGLQ